MIHLFCASFSELIKLLNDIPAAGAAKWFFDHDNNMEDKLLNQSPCANLQSLQIRKLSSKYSLRRKFKSY